MIRIALQFCNSKFLFYHSIRIQEWLLLFSIFDHREHGILTPPVQEYLPPNAVHHEGHIVVHKDKGKLVPPVKEYLPPNYYNEPPDALHVSQLPPHASYHPPTQDYYTPSTEYHPVEHHPITPHPPSGKCFLALVKPKFGIWGSWLII